MRRPTGGGATSNAQHQMRLSKETATSLSDKPKLLVPLPISTAVWLGRLARREIVNVTFTANGGDGKTHVTVAGKVGRGSDAIADREFWTDVLNTN